METDNKVARQVPPSDGEPERRFFKIQGTAEARQVDSVDRMVIGGYGAVFNSYTNMGWYAEVVLPGFFDGIKDDRCACLLNHDPNHVLGRRKNQTLEWKVDATGVEYRAVLPSSRADVYELVKDGYVYESSFAFTTLRSTWEEVDRSLLAGKLSESDLDQLSHGGKVTVRNLVQGKELFDLSPVTYGAYEATSVDTRAAKISYDEWRQTRIEEKEELRSNISDDPAWKEFFAEGTEFFKG